MFDTTTTLESFDPDLAKAIAHENRRQEEHVELIASENYASPRVMAAQGSVLTNKYAEGYPGKRYYGGCEYVDDCRNAGDRAGQDSCSAPTTPTCSRIPARRPTPRSTWRCCEPGDTVLGMSLAARRAPDPRCQGQFLRARFSTRSSTASIAETGLIDYDAGRSAGAKSTSRK